MKPMTYYFSKELECSFDEAIEKTTDVLKQNGMGVLTTIDIKEKMKEKLDVDFRRYKILGACSPRHAYKALSKEDKVGTMLPCNVIVQEHGPGRIEVAAINPVASMQAIQNPDLGEIAQEVQGLLRKVIQELA